MYCIFNLPTSKMSQALNPTQMLWLEQARKQEAEFIRKQNEEKGKTLSTSTSIPVAVNETVHAKTVAQPSPDPERAAHPGQFWQPKTNAPYTYAVNPALTRTVPNPHVVQWVQGNKVIMRPENREVMPGEQTTSIRILR